jgi:Uma2 family endonuclease
MTPIRIPAGPPARVRHLRPPRPIHFPVEEQVPEGIVHMRVRTFLWQLLEFALGPEHHVGSDQFVYWNARDPKRCLAPDVFVRLGVRQSRAGSWKSWIEGGAPELAIEIVSPSDAAGLPLQEKLTRYHELGVLELIRLDPEAPSGARLRAWDRVEEDLVEREVEGDRTPCVTLGLTWIVAPVGEEPIGLRLEDAEGRLVESKVEAEVAARAAAEARVRELEAELRKRGG